MYNVQDRVLKSIGPGPNQTSHVTYAMNVFNTQAEGWRVWVT